MLKTKTKVKISVAGLMLAVSAFLPQFLWHDTSAEEVNTTFQVNVVESLSVSIAVPQNWATGDINTLLRNKINITVNTNNPSGFTASMYSDTKASNDTDLVNAVSGDTSVPANVLPTLTSSWDRSSTTTNFWGYSTNDGSETGTYNPMRPSGNPITILSGATSQDIYFGAKANASKAAGAYLGTVVFTVVSGSSPTPSPTPVNPDDDKPNDGDATYDNNRDRTVYTTVASSGSGSSATTTTTTQVSPGNVTNMYPLGETNYTDSNITDGSGIATGLAIAASTAAVGGMAFFILAKRREEDEEDEEELR